MKYDFVTDSCPPKSDLDRVSSSSLELTHFSERIRLWCKWQARKRTFRISLDVDVASDRTGRLAGWSSRTMFFKTTELSIVMPNNYFIFMLGNRFNCATRLLCTLLGNCTQSLNRYSFQCVSVCSKAEIF